MALDTLAVRHRDPGAFLPPVLQGKQPKIGCFRGIVAVIVHKYPKYAAFLRHNVVLWLPAFVLIVPSRHKAYSPINLFKIS